MIKSYTDLTSYSIFLCFDKLAGCWSTDDACQSYWCSCPSYSRAACGIWAEL